MAPSESNKDQQTYQIRTCCRSIEHKEIQATAMSVDRVGEWSLLAGRRVLALQNLGENVDSVVRKFSRNCKYEVSSAEFANCQQTQEYCAIATNQLIEVVTWGTSEPTLLHSLRAHTRMVTDIDWHCKEPMLLATCSIDSFTHLWDLRDARRPSMSLNAVCMSGATQVGFNRISGNLLAAAHDGDLRIWDIRKGSAPIHYITAHLARVHGINWSHRRESCLATASQDGTVKYFDVNNPRRAEKIITNSSPVWRARYTPIRNGLVTIIVPHLGRGENSLLLWSNSKQTDPICSFVGHTDVILDFAWRPNRETNTELQLVTWSRDQTMKLWKIDENLLDCCDPVNLDEVANEESPESPNIRLTYDDFQSSEVMEAINIARSPVFGLEPMARSLTDQPTCSLHHEFSLLNTNHPHFQIEDYDAIKRYAVVKVQAAGHTINIQSKFPTEYPSPNIYPEFRFLAGTTIDDRNCRQFMAIMKRCALQRVKSSRTCFEPCLRILIASMKKTYITNANDKSLNRLQSPRLEGALSSTLHDACIPFPRTSGVKFNTTGLFVTFAQNLNTRILSSKHSKLTPKALSAISGGLLGNVMGTQPVLYAHRESNIQDRLNKSSRSKSIHKPITSPVVQIYDFKRLLFLNKEIAMNFEIHKSDLVGTCRRSQKIVEANGRPDLVPIWMLAELIASNCTPLEENCGELLFSNDPFKKNILESLILHFAINGDIQTAVMLCAVFHKCCPENEPATKNILSPMGSPYHTVLPIDKFNTHLSEQSLAMQLKQNRSNSWSDSLDVQDSLKTLHQEKEIFTCSLIKKSNYNLFTNFKIMYADILFGWQMLNKRSEILKNLCFVKKVKKGVEFAAECKNCGKPNKSPSCNSCKNMIMYCIICRLPVRGSANVCLICGHGGHTKHLESWFLNHDICPTGCGCQCLEENVALLEKVC